MLLSMTGFGEARLHDDRWTVTVEARTVNNRHLKVSAKVSDPYNALEPEIEKLVRDSIRRGTVNLQIRVERPRKSEDYRINSVALLSYRAQLEAADGKPVPIEALLSLPGVVEERRPATDDPHEDWPALSGVISQALRKLQLGRAEEGRVMGGELLLLGKAIANHLDHVVARGPEVVSAYQKRLIDRIQALTEGQGITIEPKDLIRETAILSERADITEEIIRLRAHLSQYVEVIHEPESAGRKLEFIVQEMGRETNTIGSKANDVEISREVVEMKGLLEKIRELIQNVE